MKNDCTLSIIIPIKIHDISLLRGFKECFLKLSSKMQNYEILIVDDNPKEIYDEIHSWFVNSKIKHFKPARKYFTGANNKLNSIEAGINKSKGEYVLLIDDDCRPDADFVRSFIKRLKEDKADCFRCLIRFKHYGLFELMDISSILFINVACTHKQFWGNIGFRKNSLKAVGYPNKDVLFDELAFYLKFNKNKKKIKYYSDLSITMEPGNNLKTYLEQRLRYAYEDLAYPLRSSLSLAVIPMALFLLSHKNAIASWMFILGIFLGLLGVGFIGQLLYGEKLPKFTFVYTPLWFLPYPLFSWFAIIAYFTGGIYFGGSKIKRVV